MSACGPGCVKTREKSSNEKIDLSKRPLRDFLEVGKGHPTNEYFEFLRFYTAWADCRLIVASATDTFRTVEGPCHRPEARQIRE